MLRSQLGARKFPKVPLLRPYCPGNLERETPDRKYETRIFQHESRTHTPERVSRCARRSCASFRLLGRCFYPGLCCGSRPLEGRSVCLCWAPSKPKGPKGPNTTRRFFCPEHQAPILLPRTPKPQALHPTPPHTRARRTRRRRWSLPLPGDGGGGGGEGQRARATQRKKERDREREREEEGETKG